MRRAKKTYPAEWDEKAPRLATVAKWINENTTLVADMERGYCNTDRRIPNSGRHLRIPGKGRQGTRLKVWVSVQHRRACVGPVTTDEERALREKHGRTSLHDHNAAETYRSNDEVVKWLKNFLRDSPKVLK